MPAIQERQPRLPPASSRDLATTTSWVFNTTTPSKYCDVAPPRGLRSAAMMCQRTTSAVILMFRALGLDCTNYIDDFGGPKTPDSAANAFRVLQSSPDKDCPPPHALLPRYRFGHRRNDVVSHNRPSLRAPSSMPLTSPRRLHPRAVVSCNNCWESCPSSQPVFVPPAFSCPVFSPRFAHTAPIGSATSLLTTNQTYAGGATFSQLTTASP